MKQNLVILFIFFSNYLLSQQVIHTHKLNLNNDNYFTLFKENLFYTGDNGVMFKDSLPDGQIILYSTDNKRNKFYKPEYIFKTGIYENYKKNGAFFTFNYELNKTRKDFFTNTESVMFYYNNNLHGLFTNGTFMGNYNMGELEGIYFDRINYGEQTINNYHNDSLYQFVILSSREGSVKIYANYDKVRRKGIYYFPRNLYDIDSVIYIDDSLNAHSVLYTNGVITKDSYFTFDSTKINIKYRNSYNIKPNGLFSYSEFNSFLRLLSSLNSISYEYNESGVIKRIIKVTDGVIKIEDKR